MNRAPSAEELAVATVLYEPQEVRHLNGADKALPLLFLPDLKTVAAPDRLVRHLMGSSTLVTVIGLPACGKSFLVLDLALSIALGRPWFGRDVTQGPALYVAAEAAATIANRIVAAGSAYPIPDDTPFAVVPVAVDLGPGGKDADRVIAAAAAIEARAGQAVQIIIIDTLARTFGSGDENSTQDMNAYIKTCDRIRLATNATVVIVHHKGKSQGSGSRGSSVLPGNVDTYIDVGKQEGVCTAEVIKQKDGVTGIKLNFRLDPVEVGRDEDGEPITSCVVRSTDEEVKRPPKLSPIEKRALDVLRNTIVDHGERPPNSVTFPNVTLVKTKRFRAALKSAGVTDRDTPANERSQWRRITTNLCNKGVFVVRDDLCWTA